MMIGVPKCMVCRQKAFYRTQCYGATFKCPKCLEVTETRAILTGPCGHLLCAGCDLEWAARHEVYPQILSDYNPMEVEEFALAVQGETETGANPDAEAETLPWVSPPVEEESDEEPAGPPPDPNPTRFPLFQYVPAPMAPRFSRLGYEMIRGSDVFRYEDQYCVWAYSTRFWEIVLLNASNSGLALWSPRVPQGLADWTPLWRAVNRTENRRWTLIAGTTPLVRVEGVPRMPESF